MVRTFYSLEELGKEYDQANSEEKDEILEKINQLQLQCNMEATGETSLGNPLIVQDSAQSGAREVQPNSQTQLDSQMASSDEEEAQRYRYRHTSSRQRRKGARHLFPHPGHAYPLSNAGAVLNIDCVSNTDDVIKEWVKALLIYTGVTRTDGEELKVFIPLTLSGKVADWFTALPEETKIRYLGDTTTNDNKTIINTIENEIRREFLGDHAQHPLNEK